MFTIVASSTTISWATPSRARISQRRSWVEEVWDAMWVCLDSKKRRTYLNLFKEP